MQINFSDPKWLANAMDAANISIAELARRSKVSRDQIERLRKDATKTRVATAQALADGLKAAA